MPIKSKHQIKENSFCNSQRLLGGIWKSLFSLNSRRLCRQVHCKPFVMGRKTRFRLNKSAYGKTTTLIRFDSFTYSDPYPYVMLFLKVSLELIEWYFASVGFSLCRHVK